MTLLTDLAATLQTLLTTEAEQAARETGFIQRQRKLTGPLFVQTLVFGWLHNPQAPLEDLADLAADLGADLSPQALDQRFTPAATQCLANVLTAALQRVVTAQPLALPLLRRFHGVYVYDTTTVSLPAALAALFPGCGGSTPDVGQAALKCHVGLELTCGALDLILGAGRQPDVTSALANAPLPPGALRLADCGFFDLTQLQDFSDAGVYWISRVPARTVVYNAAGTKQALTSLLRSCPDDRLDVTVEVGRTARLPCRLVALRLPPAVVAQRRARLLKQAKKKGRKVSAAQLTLCQWNVYITNVPATLLRLEEVWVLTRARWQIELLFKLWKSHGGLDQSNGQRACRVLCEVYAKLVGMVVQHWTLLVCGGSFLQWSFPKAARRVRRAAEALARAVGALAELVQVLERLQRRLSRRCRVQDRQGRPSTYQLLKDPSLANLDQETPNNRSNSQAA